MAQVYTPTPDAPKVRLMVLETDKPHPDTESEKGSFGHIVHAHFSKAGAAHHPPLAVETNQVFVVTEQGGRIPTKEEFDGYDGLLITGSVYDAHGNNPWILQLLVLLKGLPNLPSARRGFNLAKQFPDLWLSNPDFHFTGVCFGHQLLSRLLGGTVAPSPRGDWELGHCRIDITATGQRLFRTRQDHIHLHQMHQDQVTHTPTYESARGMIPQDVEIAVWGSSPHTAVQGLYIPNRLFTTQAHLAFDEDMVRRQIQMRVDKGSIQDIEHADRAAETADLDHDGVRVAEAILRLFVYDDDGMGFERR